MGVTLANAQDVKDRLGRDLNAPETAAWANVAKEASVIVEGYLNRQWTDFAEVPDAVRVVTSRMTVRAMQAPTGSTAPVDGQRGFSSTFGPMSHNRTFGEDAVFSTPWLSKADRAALAPYVMRAGVFNEPMYDPAVFDRTGYDFYEPGWSSS